MQNHTYDFIGKFAAFSLEPFLRGELVLFDSSTRFVNLRLSPLARFRDGVCPPLSGGLATSFLRFEYRDSRFPQALLVFRGPGLGSRDIGSRLLNRSFRFAAPFCQNSGQWSMNEDGVRPPKQEHEDNRRN
jgi:hypothetical protein